MQDSQNSKVLQPTNKIQQQQSQQFQNNTGINNFNHPQQQQQQRQIPMSAQQNQNINPMNSNNTNGEGYKENEQYQQNQPIQQQQQQQQTEFKQNPDYFPNQQQQQQQQDFNNNSSSNNNNPQQQQQQMYSNFNPNFQGLTPQQAQQQQQWENYNNQQQLQQNQPKNQQTPLENNNATTTTNANNNTQQFNNFQQQQQSSNNNSAQLQQQQPQQQQQQQPQQQQQEAGDGSQQVAPRRRARNDPNNRDFQCPCGKKYLSYPALFTHVKQKHNGKPPGELVRPRTSDQPRGRPRKDTNIKEVGEEELENESTASHEALGVIEELQLYIHKVDQDAIIVDNKEQKAEVLKEFFPRQSFFGENFQQGQNPFEAIYDHYCKILDNGGKIEETLTPHNLYTTPCNQIFAMFLYKISKHLQPEIVREIGVYCCFFRIYLNKYGWEATESVIKQQQDLQQQNNTNSSQEELEMPTAFNRLDEFGNSKEIDKTKEYCAENSAWDVLEIMNDFIMVELPILFEQYKEQLKDYKVITEEHRLTHVLKISNFFSDWLYANKYNDDKLELNDDERDDDL